LRKEFEEVDMFSKEIINQLKRGNKKNTQHEAVIIEN
jgi:hypothetical protein